MEEMETEELTPDQIYRPKDVVWVKLSAGAMWWPGRVQDMATLDPEVTEGLKKQPLFVVKFLHEDTYEFVRSYDHIYLYNCKRKEEFLKLGFKKYYKLNNEKNVSMFPEDVEEAERLTNGDPEIIRDPKYLPQEALEPVKVENGGRNSLPADFKGRKANAARMSAPSQSGDSVSSENNGAGKSKGGRPPIVKQGPTWYPYPKFFEVDFSSDRRPPSDDPSVKKAELHICSRCCFETINFELLMLHNKYNQHSTVSQPNRYRWRNPGSVRRPGTGVKKTSVKAKKDGTPKSVEKKSAKKKKKDLPPVPAGEFTPPKKPKMSLPGTPDPLEVSQACAKIIEEWTDDEEENKPSDDTIQHLLDETTADDSILETATEAAELEKDEQKQTPPEKADKPSEAPKASSCFDFDDEEPAEPGLQSSGKFGQIRLPRVITPEKSKPPDPLDDGNDIDNLLKEVSVPEIPALPPTKQDSLFSRGERTYGSSPFKDAKKPGVASPVKSDPNVDAHADSENNKNEEKHFLAEGPLQSKKRKSFGLTEGAEDGSDVNKKLKVGASPKKPSNEEVVAPREVDDESSKITAKTLAAERAKQSLIDTLTHSPKPDDADENTGQICDERKNIPVPRVEKTEDSLERGRKSENQGEPLQSIPCESLELVVSEPSDKSCIVSKDKDRPTNEQNLESAPSCKSVRRSSRAPRESEIRPSGRTKGDTQTKAPEAHVKSDGKAKIRENRPAAQKKLTEFREVSTPTPCDEEKDAKPGAVPSILDVPHEVCKQSPANRRSRRNKSDPEDIRGVSNKLPAEGMQEKKAVCEETSPEVPEQSKLHYIPRRKSDRHRQSPSVADQNPPDCEVQNVEDIMKLKTSESEPSEIPALENLADPEEKSPAFHSGAPKRDVVSDRAPTDVLEKLKSPFTSRKSNRNKKSGGSDQAKPLPHDEDSAADIGAIQHEPWEMGECTKADVTSDSILPPKLSRRSTRGKHVPASSLPEEEKMPQSEVMKAEDVLVKGVAEAEVVNDGASGNVSEMVKPPLTPREISHQSEKGDVSESVLLKGEVSKAEDVLMQQVLVAETKLLSEEDQPQNPGVIIDGTPGDAKPLPVSSESSHQNTVEDISELAVPKGTDSSKVVTIHDTQEVLAGTVKTEASKVKESPKSSGKSMRGKSPSQAKAGEIEQGKLPQAEGKVGKVEDTISLEEHLAESEPLVGKEERRKTDFGERDEPVKSLPTSRKSIRYKAVRSHETVELTEISTDILHSEEQLEAAGATPGPVHSTPKPTRRSARNKSVEPVESAAMRLDETPKRSASPEESETPRSSRSFKKFKSSKDPLETQSVLAEGTSKADVTPESSEYTELPSSDGKQPSNAIRQESLVQKTPAVSRKTKKLGSESKLQRESIKLEAESDRVLQDVPECLKSPSRETSSKKPSTVEEPHKSSRRSQRNRSQEVPVSIPLPEDGLPTPAVVPEIPSENPELQGSPTKEASANLGSPKFESSRRSKRISSQEVPVSIPLPKGDLPSDMNSLKLSLELQQSLKPPTRDTSSQESSKVVQSPKVSKNDATASDFTVPKKSPKSKTKSRAPHEDVELKSPVQAPKLDSIHEPQKDSEKSPSAAKTSATIVPEDRKASEKLRSSKKRERRKHSQEVSEHLSVGEPVTQKLQDESKPIEPYKVDCASKLKANTSSGSKLLLSLAEKLEDEGSMLPVENVEPSEPTSVEKAGDATVDEPPAPSSTPVPSHESTSESLHESDIPKTDSAASVIPQDGLEPTIKLPFDEVLTSKSSRESVPVVNKHPRSTRKINRTKARNTPEAVSTTEPIAASAGIGSSQEPDEIRQAKDSKATSKKSKLVSEEPAESKLLPESATRKRDSHSKESSEVSGSRSSSKEGKSKEKYKKSETKSHRQEKSPRASRSTSKDVKDVPKGSPREDKSSSESRTPKRESESKEKQRKDKVEEYSSRRVEQSQVDLQSKADAGAGLPGSSTLHVSSEVIEKLDSAEQCKSEVVIEAATAGSTGVTEKLTQKPLTKDSPQKKKSKWDETPKVEETVTVCTIETSKATEPASGASKIVESPPSLSKPLEITVFDSKNEIVVDTDLPTSSSKKEMVHSPSKTFRQDEAASLLEELLGSSPKSSPTSSPKKLGPVASVKVTQDIPLQRTADIKFSLSPSRVLDFGTPLKAKSGLEPTSEDPPKPISEITAAPSTVHSSLKASASPGKASRWDSPFLGKSSTPLAASPTKNQQSPGRKVKTEIISGLSRSCFKTSSAENNVVLDAPPKPSVEPESSSNQSDDELSALQAEIMSYSAIDKAKSTLASELEKEAPVRSTEVEMLPNSMQLQTSTPSTEHSPEKTQDEKEPFVSPVKSVGAKTSHVNMQPAHPPSQPALPAKLPGLSEADLLASLDDAISFPLDEPDSDPVRSHASDAAPTAKASNAPILITVPSDSVQGTDSAVKIVGTERQAVGNGLAQGFGTGADLLVMDLDINSIPIIMTQEEGVLPYSDAPVAAISTASTAAPATTTEPVSSIPLPSEKPSKQLRAVSTVNCSRRTSSVTTSEQVKTVTQAPKEEIIETEIVMDHSETEQQNCETSFLSLEEKFEQALVKQPWLRPDLLEVLTKGATEKKVFEARKVTQLVISLYDEDHPDYSYYMSLPPCQVGTSNFTKSWATIRPSKIATAALSPATHPSKTKPTSTSANSVRLPATNHTSARQVLNVDKSNSIVTVTRPEMGGDVIFADSSTKPVIVGTQSLTVPANAVRQAGTSPVKTSPAQVKQQLLHLLNKAQSGELDAETTRKLNAITSNPDFMAKINKQQKVVVSSRPSADVKIQPLGLVAKTASVRASPTAKIVSSIPGSPVLISQSKPIMVAAVSTPGAQPKPNILSTATRGEPLKFTMESKFMNIQIASNTPKYVVACNPVTGVPSVKPQIVIGRNASAGAGPSRVPVPSTTQAIVMGGLAVPSKTQTVNVVNPGSTAVKVVSAVPRPRIMQRAKSVAPTGSVPTARLSQPQAVRLRKQLPQGQTQSGRPTSKTETFTYVTIKNNMVLPNSSEQVYVLNKTKPSVAPGSDILAKALADTDILPSDSEAFAEGSSTDLFSPTSVVIAGSLGADQLTAMSFDPAETDNVNR